MGFGLELAASIGSAALGAFGTISSAASKKSALAYERAQLEDDRRLARIEAIEQENERRERAGMVKSSQIAQAIASGYDPFTSGSFAAIQSDEDEQMQRDITGIRLMGANKDRRYGLALQANRAASRGASRSMLLAGAGFLARSGYAYYKSQKTDPEG